MKRFYHGPKSGISTDSLSYTQVCHYPVRSVYPDMIWLFSREAQICPEPLGLHVRMQDILLARTRDQLLFDQSNNWRWDPFEICMHFRLLEFVTPTVKSLKNGEMASFAHICHMCNIDCHIEIVEFDSKIALIMTRWVNLGAGLTQEDPWWKIRVRVPAGLYLRLDRDYPEHFLTAQSPRSCFEDIAPQSFEDLQSHNLSYLRDQRYKTVMPFVGLCTDLWHISYKEPSNKSTSKFLRSLLGRSAIFRESGLLTERTRRKSPIYNAASRRSSLSLDSIFDDMVLKPILMGWESI